MSKNKAITAHGELEYETVECAHCGNAVMEENAVGCAVGVKVKSGGVFNKAKLSSGVNRNLCEYCAESIFGKSSTWGAIPVGLEILYWRASEMSDVGFAVVMASFIGFFACLFGVVAGSAIYELITVLLGVIA